MFLARNLHNANAPVGCTLRYASARFFPQKPTARLLQSRFDYRDLHGNPLLFALALSGHAVTGFWDLALQGLLASDQKNRIGGQACRFRQ